MDHDDCCDRTGQFAAYLGDLASVLGGVLGGGQRVGPLTSYCTGLLLPADCKRGEPMAALMAPDRTAAQHQSMLHFVGQGDSSDAAVLERIRAHVLPRMQAHDAVLALILDDTGFPKKDKHSLGVVSQYCGQLGK